MSVSYEYEFNKSPKCPHCGEDAHKANADWALDVSYEDGDMSELQCGACGKSYVAVAHVTHEFSTATTEERASDDLWGPEDATEAA